jgi:hypothetical protein
VELLWREISPSQGRYLHSGQHKQNKRKHPCLEWDSNPRSQCSSGRRRFMPQTAPPLWSALYQLIIKNWEAYIHSYRKLFSSTRSPIFVPVAAVTSRRSICVLFVTSKSYRQCKREVSMFWFRGSAVSRRVKNMRKKCSAKILRLQFWDRAANKIPKSTKKYGKGKVAPVTKDRSVKEHGRRGSEARCLGL